LGKQPRRRQTVPRYLVKRTFPGGLAIPVDDAGANLLRRVCDINAALGVDWLHSYVTEVSVLDPHFYR
jgi:hypothetical protein